LNKPFFKHPFELAGTPHRCQTSMLIIRKASKISKKIVRLIYGSGVFFQIVGFLKLPH
jgi:hypothetical protein